MGWGERGLGGIPMKETFTQMDRGGGWVLTHGKRRSMCVLSVLYLPAHLYR